MSITAGASVSNEDKGTMLAQVVPNLSEGWGDNLCCLTRNFVVLAQCRSVAPQY